MIYTRYYIRYQLALLVLVLGVVWGFILSSIVVVLTRAPSLQQLEIRPTSTHNIASGGNEIWVQGLFLANGIQESWLHFSVHGGTKNDQMLALSGNQPGAIQWQGYLRRNAWLALSTHQWSGVAEIRWNGKSQLVDLYSPKTSRKFIPLPVEASLPVSKIILTYITCFIFSILLFYYIFNNRIPGYNKIIAFFPFSRYSYSYSSALIHITILVTILFLSFTLRMYAINNIYFNDITLNWDATGYWLRSQEIRNTICSGTSFCKPNTNFNASSLTKIIYIVTGRPGLLPLIAGGLMTILPAYTTTVHVLFALLDTIVCLAAFDTMRRLNASIYISISAAALQAIYIPNITGDVTFLQQPLIRFLTMLIIWIYTRALTSHHRISYWLAAGTFATLLLGFSVLTLRLMIWFILIAVVVTTFLHQHSRSKARLQLIYTVILFGFLTSAAVLLELTLPGESWFIRLVTGWSTEASSVATFPSSFPHFWPPNDYSHILSLNNSLVESFINHQGNFLHWFAFSIAANWYYPDYAYFQHFLLTLKQQQIQHSIMVVSAILGIAWLLYYSRPTQQITLLMLAIAVGMSLLYGLVSVEPRRLAALTPVVVIGSAGFLWAATKMWSSLRHKRNKSWLALFAGCVLLWSAPLSLVLWVLPLSPSVAYGILVVSRMLTTGIIILWFTLIRQPTYRRLRFLRSALFLVGITAFISYNAFQVEWRSWEAHTNTRVQQQIEGVHNVLHMWPWLLVDGDIKEQGRGLEVAVNDRVVKPYGMPMAHWSAQVGAFAPMSDAEAFSNVPVEQRGWLALPLTKQLLNNKQLTVKVHLKEDGLVLRGDYMDSAAGPYVGPLLDPWNTGTSFWRWQWNANDPRIPWKQDFNGQTYVSSIMNGASWATNDLSPELGKQTGVFRIFLVHAPFGPHNNILANPSSRAIYEFPPHAQCTSDKDTLIITGLETPYLCKNGNRSVTYFAADGSPIGTSPASVFTQRNPSNTVIDSVESKVTSFSRIEVVQVYATMFIANFYGNDDLIYSLAFESQ